MIYDHSNHVCFVCFSSRIENFFFNLSLRSWIQFNVLMKLQIFISRFDEAQTFFSLIIQALKKKFQIVFDDFKKITKSVFNDLKKFLKMFSKTVLINLMSNSNERNLNWRYLRSKWVNELWKRIQTLVQRRR